MAVHHLKCWPEWFQALRDGSKTAEVRLDDRNFQVSDYLCLEQWDPLTQEYIRGPMENRFVSHVLRDHPGLAPGYVMLSLRR